MIVSATPKIKTFISILAVEATAGFIISTNGLIRNRDISESDIAIPLKKPATPIPNVNHIFSHRDDTKSINANTGKDDTCLLYTSDAADERHCVDLGGSHINQKKKQ